jgi:glycosyltransferase involved in cell wall biosynthesis
MTTDSRADAISVLIRSFNSAKTIGRLLSSLSLRPGDEVLVVDSGSTDKTLAIAASHSARVLHAPPPFNYSKSLNIGFQAAQNPWVLVMSSHTLPLIPDLLEVFRSAGREFPDRVVVGYGLNPIDRQKRYPDDRIRYFTHDDLPAIIDSCTNGNTLYRRSGWEAIPFDETIRTGEDRAWVIALVHQGYEAAVVPAAWTLNMSQYPLRYMFAKGYSDRRSDPGKPITLWGLFLSVASLMKRLIRYRMPFGNYIRYTAHAFGQFFGSYGKQDNQPWA